MIDILLDEAAVALGLGTARLVWRFGWPHLRAWARDFALSDVD